MEEENKQLKEQVLKLDILLLRQVIQDRKYWGSGVPESANAKCVDIIYEIVMSTGLQPREGDVQVAHLVKTFSSKRPYHILP